MTTLQCFCGCNIKVSSAKGKDYLYRTCDKCGVVIRIVYGVCVTLYLDKGLNIGVVK